MFLVRVPRLLKNCFAPPPIKKPGSATDRHCFDSSSSSSNRGRTQWRIQGHPRPRPPSAFSKFFQVKKSFHKPTIVASSAIPPSTKSGSATGRTSNKVKRVAQRPAFTEKATAQESKFKQLLCEIDLPITKGLGPGYKKIRLFIPVCRLLLVAGLCEMRGKYLGTIEKRCRAIKSERNRDKIKHRPTKKNYNFDRVDRQLCNRFHRLRH